MTSHTEVARLKGLIASGAMSVASPHDGAVFYSDDAGRNRIAAEAYAKRCGQAGKQTTTLEATPCGQWLESEHLYASPLALSADDIWAEASVKYAREASGSCRCFVAHAPSDRVFRKHELATLLDNDKVTDLNNIPRQTRGFLGGGAHGGLQIIVYPMKAERYRAWLKVQRMRACESVMEYLDMPAFCRRSGEMGLAPGGLMRQQIHDDEYGLDAWDTSLGQRCFVHLLNSEQWHSVTGQYPPGRAPRARDYTKAGLPWFEHYDEGAACRPGAPRLAGMDSVAAKAVKLGQSVLPENDAVTPDHVVELGPRWHQVTDGRW